MPVALDDGDARAEFFGKCHACFDRGEAVLARQNQLRWNVYGFGDRTAILVGTAGNQIRVQRVAVANGWSTRLSVGAQDVGGRCCRGPEEISEQLFARNPGRIWQTRWHGGVCRERARVWPGMKRERLSGEMTKSCG